MPLPVSQMATAHANELIHFGRFVVCPSALEAAQKNAITKQTIAAVFRQPYVLERFDTGVIASPPTCP